MGAVFLVLIGSFVYLLSSGLRSEQEVPIENLLLEETYLAKSGEMVDSAAVDSVRESQSNAEEEAIIIVDIKGAVRQPGVYQGEENMRVMDIVSLAGGLLDTADDKSVNLAQRISDQMVIYIPVVGENVERSPDEGESFQISIEQEEDAESEKVNINIADAVQLQTLNGIGEKKAEQIIAYRKENGSFQTIEDIMGVSGIGEKTFEGFKAAITVNEK